MNRTEERYTRYALCREMLDTIDVIRNFDPSIIHDLAEATAQAGRLLLTGEGSSRIFPAKNTIRKALTAGAEVQIVTEGSRQAATYRLGDFVVCAASNSGQTKEVVTLLETLKGEGHEQLFGLCAKAENRLSDLTRQTLVLNCGWENAVAATKSVVEQALVYQSLISKLIAQPLGDLQEAADAFEQALTGHIDPAIIEKACQAPVIYFAGYNDGVAEELTLKTNEITRSRSDYLEGTYAVHGIEEVMDKADIVFVVDPIDEEVHKFKEVLVDGVELTVVAIADRPIDGFPTIQVPAAGPLQPMVYLAAGWAVLVEIGLALKIDLDKPQRARKVGNAV
jgi:glucosamine--fructose-6-phosphate aminotransferase (isomerizing)